jgi:hypothetical protein
MASENQPTHNVKMHARTLGHKKDLRTSIVAKLWDNGDGTYGLVLQPGVTLSWRDHEDFTLKAWPIDGKKSARKGKPVRKKSRGL